MAGSSRRVRLALLAAMAVALPGCLHRGYTDPAAPLRFEAVDAPVEMAARFLPGSTELAPPTLDGLVVALQQAARPGQGAEVDIGGAGDLAAERARALETLGAVYAASLAVRTVTALPDGEVRIRVPGGAVILLPCMVPPEASLPPGCANALNLLSMVERPTDLLAGRDIGPPSGAAIAAAAARYDLTLGGGSGAAGGEDAQRTPPAPGGRAPAPNVLPAAPQPVPDGAGG